MAALTGDKTLVELVQRAKARRNRITERKLLLQSHAADLFGGVKSEPPELDIKSMHAKIGQLAADE